MDDRTYALVLGTGAVLLTVGGLFGYLGVAAGPCGVTEIRVSEVPADEVDEPAGYTDYGDLSAEQRRLFDEARRSGRAVDEDDDADPFPQVADEGRYYSVSAAISECAFDPATLLGVGGVLVLAGVGTVGASVRRF